MNVHQLLPRKLRKLIFSPGLFFRDYLNKKYPVIRNEVSCPEDEETIVINNALRLETLFEGDFPVDVVFTWVNDKDPRWQEKYNAEKNIGVEHHGQYATDAARFSNHNELYFSVQSVIKFLPWIRNIYIITDDQQPGWINEFPSVKVVDHREIIDPEFLPTFNSHVIEAHLHKIPELAEHFIYFNDDVFVARALPKGHFFKSNGIASVFPAKKDLSEMRSRGVTTPTLNASFHVSELLERDLGERIETPLVHTYVPLRKSMFENVWSNYHDQIREFLPHKFRTDQDLNLATFFVPWFSYLKGNAVPEHDICYYFNIRSPVAQHYYTALKRFKNESAPHSFCANDFSTTKQSVENYQHALIEMLTKYFSKGN